MELAQRLKEIKPSLTLALSARAKKIKSEGKDVVDFGSGEPDFDTPDFIKEEAISAIKTGFTKYTPTTGIWELKKLISEKLKKDNSLEYEPSCIVVSSGAKHSIFNALFALIDSGDEVIIPSPYWVSYPEMVSLCQGKPRILETSPLNDFKISPEELEKSINPKTKVLILNSPANPTGVVYSKSELEDIAQICVEKGVSIISDEIYEKIIYDDLEHISIAGLNKDASKITLTVNGVSKTYSMTGWRIGYLAGPSEIIEAISKIQDHSTSCPSSISQKAACAALSKDDQFSQDMRQEFQKRRDYIAERLGRIKDMGFLKPKGTFYIFCDIKKTGLSSCEFSERLLNEEQVLVTPGYAFGRDDYVRISFATSILQIEKGMKRLEQWVKQLSRKS